MRAFIDWWLELGTWWKVSAALILILISTVLFLAFDR
jgi:hypothetical protein